MSGESDQLTWQSAWSLRERMAAKELSPVEVTEHFLDRIGQLDSDLHAFITVDPEGALDQARAAERAILAGEELGPLHGVPLGIKDQFWTKGLRTTGGSAVFKDFVPTEDSVHAERVRRAGAVILGKTNTPEFGLYGRTVNRVAQESRNPWNVELTTGGSSGGSAGGLAGGLFPLAIGSDGGGSIRLPAAYCGVYGIHPSNGRVPRHGSFGGALTCSGVGPMSRDVRDSAILFGVMAGPDPRDPTCMLDEPPDYLSNLDAGMENFRIAWTSDYGMVDEPAVDMAFVRAAKAAAERFQDLGAVVEEISPDFGEWQLAFGTVSAADRYASLGERLYGDPVTRQQLTSYGAKMFGDARTITGAEYSRALRVQFDTSRRLREAMNGYDLLLTPTTLLPPQPASGLAGAGQSDPGGSPAYGSYASIVNFTGFAAASVPCGFVGGLPAGLQIISRPNEEAAVFRASRAYEAAFPWADHYSAGPTAGQGARP